MAPKPLTHHFFVKTRRIHAEILSLFPHPSAPPLIPQNSNIHNLDSQIPPKTTHCCNKTLENGFLSSKLLDSVAKFDKMSNSYTHRRAISSSPSDAFASDAVSTVNSPSTPIDAGSSIRKPISLWPGMYHSPVTNALWEARSKFFEKMSENGSSQSELIAKNPSQSRTSILYKFSSDYILREQYRNPWNEIRMGKLLEDLDALAGTISLKFYH